MGTREQLVAGLLRVAGQKPDSLVPSHGRVMTSPAKAIDALVARLEVCYDKYVAISALRHYFPKMFAAYDGRAGHMPIRKGKAVPDCLRHFGTTWMLISKTGGALVMDCGSADAVQQVRKALQAGTIRSVEALWVTHYHDDHVDGIPAFREAFDCPCITDASVAEVIGDPLAWRLPCIAPHRIRVDRPTKDGESWQWHEFKLTAYHLPGQTLYHAGLLVEGKDLRMLFAGDSFTAAGIDDYCMGNRNWLGRDVGFDHCLALIEKLQPTHIFNPHVEDAFDFTDEQIHFMRANLAQREALFGRVVPWGHANFGMDDSWVRCHPYEQASAAGADAAFDVVVTNHGAASQQVSARAVPPRAWAQPATRPAAGDQIAGTDWAHAEVRPKRDGRLRLSLRVPAGVKPGRYVIPVDIRFGARELPQFTEAIVVVP
jgi:glyoxylase-like metal-dependent hydrolase (beta-lactamase superfamily II)